MDVEGTYFIGNTDEEQLISATLVAQPGDFIRPATSHSDVTRISGNYNLNLKFTADCSSPSQEDFPEIGRIC